jgi:hypothetical protein
MTIKNDLSSLKAGDKAFETVLGKIEITDISRDENASYPIKTIHGTYTIDGRRLYDYRNPSLFLSAKHASEYFASIKEKKQIYVEYYVHDFLNYDGYPCRYTSDNATFISDSESLEIYLGCTEINKTYEIEE